jgi:flagellar hook-length control protein FliK
LLAEAAEKTTSFREVAAQVHGAADNARTDAAPASAALLAAGLAATAPSAPAEAPTVVHLPTPVDAPEFTQSLGVQVSVLAADGVQQAELHLNPAEMGPISVQIAIDGTQAQVDFGADMASTRQLIESGLPELASALRDAGFTLTGGGVSQQARQGSPDGGQGRGEGGSRSRSVGGVEAAETAPRRVTTRVSAGGVDLYA